VGKQILFALKLGELKVEDMAGATKLWCKHGHLRGFAYHLLTFRKNYTDPSQGKQLCPHVRFIPVIEIWLLPATSERFPQADKHRDREGGGRIQPLSCPFWVSLNLEFIFQLHFRRKGVISHLLCFWYLLRYRNEGDPVLQAALPGKVRMLCGRVCGRW